MSDSRQTHGVALVIMPEMAGHPEPFIRVQCECGWYANFNTPMTLQRVYEVACWPHLSSGTLTPGDLDQAAERVIRRLPRSDQVAIADALAWEAPEP